MFRLGWVIALMIIAGPALASDRAERAERTEWVNDAGTGQFLVRSGQGWEPALLLETEAEIEVNGPVAEVTITQHFSNRERSFAEGIYVFPLPQDAAIHGMEMIVGHKRIRGVIHEKEAAREIYEKARDEGKRTGLVEQQRPNVFTTSVANIAAGEEVAVEIRYTQVIERDGRRFSLRLPLTITPRYAPADATAEPSSDRSGEQAEGGSAGSIPTDIDQAAQRTAAMGEDDQQARIRARVNTGLPVTDLVSRSHDIRSHRTDSTINVTLAEQKVAMDKDFLLSWELAAKAEPAAHFFTETVEGEPYGLLMMMPPERASGADAGAPGVRKEQILVVDRSGSMRGDRMVQARRSALHALRRLDAQDRFNVVAFNDRTQTLFPQPVRATREHLDAARDFIDALEADDGTRMLPALERALAMKRGEEYLRQVIFVTDGAVANEDAVLQSVHENLDGTRLFPVAIGDAPNNYLLRRLARFGRGTHTAIQDASEVQTRMQRLLDRIARPALRDIRVELPDGVTADFAPSKIPDLYLGEPLVIAARFNRMPEGLTVHGENPQPWSRRIGADPEQGDAGIASLWARRRIATLMDRLAQGADKERIRPDVVDIALQHALVSRFTSFVAVEDKRVRREGEALDSEQITGRLPEDMQKAGRGFPDTALHTALQVRLALLLALAGVLVLVLSGRGTRRHVRG